MKRHVHKVELVLNFPTPIAYEEAEQMVFKSLNEGGFRNANGDKLINNI